MSIPKEPRQLMINLMYLVLTAMLALNVSAEIINAFFRIDKSIVGTNVLLADSNTKSLASMAAEVAKRTDDQPLLDKAKEAQTIVAEFNTYIDGVREKLSKEAGGIIPETDKDKTRAGKPDRFKDKDIPQRLFVDGSGNGKGALGPEIKQHILDTRNKLVGLLNVLESSGKMDKKEIESMRKNLSLNVDDESWKTYGKKSWEQFNFGYMPVMACYPILSKMQNDAKNSESSIINMLASKVGATIIKFDKFVPVSAPEKTYVIAGEKFSTDIFMSATSSELKTGVNYSVNGTGLAIKDGVGRYETTTGNDVGEKTYKVNINMTNPYTGKTESFVKDFKYEVGRRSAACSADKMNVFYMGVDNPLSVSVAGASSNQLKVESSGPITLNKTAEGKYNVRANSQGEATVNVSAPGITQGFKFRCKMIPNPVAKLNGKRGGTFGNGEFKAIAGIYAELENFDFDAKCSISNYIFVKIKKNEDPATHPNNGGNYDGESQRLRNSAMPGDTYIFQNIKGMCPGDVAGRDLGTLTFVIR
jgi:gliding motility-associated protein GldM